jgi:hypothetical protein
LGFPRQRNYVISSYVCAHRRKSGKSEKQGSKLHNGDAAASSGVGVCGTGFVDDVIEHLLDFLRSCVLEDMVVMSEEVSIQITMRKSGEVLVKRAQTCQTTKL